MKIFYVNFIHQISPEHERVNELTQLFRKSSGNFASYIILSYALHSFLSFFLIFSSFVRLLELEKIIIQIKITELRNFRFLIAAWYWKNNLIKFAKLYAYFYKVQVMVSRNCFSTCTLFFSFLLFPIIFANNEVQFTLLESSSRTIK